MAQKLEQIYEPKFYDGRNEHMKKLTGMLLGFFMVLLLSGCGGDGALNPNSTYSYWIYLLIAWMPIVSLIVGLILIVVGLVTRNTKVHLSRGIMIFGLGCIGTCMAVVMILFLAGALGIGPVPN